jgi:hypothetical protein
MKTQIHLLSVLLLLSCATVAQTPRLCLYEIFTGENCPPAAATTPGLYSLLASPTNTPKIVTLNWEVPIPSAPSNTWSLYQTNSTEINWRYKPTATGGYGYPSQWTSSTATTSGINAAPTGLIDGQHQWVFGASSDHPANLNNSIITTAQSYTSAFSITMNRTWNSNATAVTVTVNVLATANFNATGSLVFRTVMTERNINFTSSPGTNGETHFEYVAVKSFPSLQSGVAMASTWTIGQTQSFTLNCTLPSYIRDISQVDFVGFIQDDGNRTVAQACRTGLDPFANDIKALSAIPNNLSCPFDPFTPTIVVQNSGTTTITSFTLTPYINAIAQSNHIWNGSLAASSTATISLSSMTLQNAAVGSNTFSYTIVNVSGGEIYTGNNSSSASFTVQTAGPAVSVTPSYTLVCVGAPVIITPSGGGTSYIINPGNIMTSASTPFTVYPTANTTYSITGMNSSGCVSPSAAVCQVSINTASSPTVVINGNASTICSGTSITLTGSGANTYTLNPGGLNGNTYNLTPSVTTIYTLTGTNSQNCISINTATQIITVNPTPTISASGGTLCIPNSFTTNPPSFTIIPSGASVYTIFIPGSWSIPGPSVVVSPTSTTTYSVVGSSAGCASQNTAAVTVNVFPYDITNVDVASTLPGLCAGATTTITAAGADTYTWTGTTFSNPIISNTIVVGAGTYSVIGMKIVSTCIFKTSIVIIALDCTVGMKEITDLKDIRIFPVPANESLRVECDNILVGKQFRITDVIGREIVNRTITSTEMTLDVSSLPPGIYLIKVEECTMRMIKN